MTPGRVTQVPSGCWVACLAGLTDIPHDDLVAFVPNVSVDDALKGDSEFRMAWTEYHNSVVRFMHQRGWTYASLGSRIPKGFAIGVGKSPRGVDHAVITLDGKLWWDPHPSRDGIESITQFEVVVPILGMAE